MVGDGCGGLGLRYLRLDGQTPQAERQLMIDPSPNPNPNPNQASAAARASIDWRGLQLVLARPPLTDARRGKAAAVVGSGFGGAAAAYDESLRYLAEIDERCDRR